MSQNVAWIVYSRAVQFSVKAFEKAIIFSKKKKYYVYSTYRLKLTSLVKLYSFVWVNSRIQMKVMFFILFIFK